MKPKVLSEDQLLLLLRDRVSAAANQKKAADEMGISEQYLSDVLKGRRHPGLAVVSALGYERVVIYRKGP